jgi:hypothetical protein
MAAITIGRNCKRQKKESAEIFLCIILAKKYIIQYSNILKTKVFNIIDFMHILYTNVPVSENLLYRFKNMKNVFDFFKKVGFNFQ